MALLEWSWMDVDENSKITIDLCDQVTTGKQKSFQKANNLSISRISISYISVVQISPPRQKHIHENLLKNARQMTRQNVGERRWIGSHGKVAARCRVPLCWIINNNSVELIAAVVTRWWVVVVVTRVVCVKHFVWVERMKCMNAMIRIKMVIYRKCPNREPSRRCTSTSQTKYIVRAHSPTTRYESTRFETDNKKCAFWSETKTESFSCVDVKETTMSRLCTSLRSLRTDAHTIAWYGGTAK